MKLKMTGIIDEMCVKKALNPIKSPINMTHTRTVQCHKQKKKFDRVTGKRRILKYYSEQVFVDMTAT